MKRFLFALLIILCFSSCSVIKQDHWVAVQVFQNDRLLNSQYDSRAGIHYISLDVNETFDLRYFLIPECDEHITITSLEYDKDILSLVSSDNSTITFKPLKTGIPYIKIKTKKHGSGTPLELRIKD